MRKSLLLILITIVLSVVSAILTVNFIVNDKDVFDSDYQSFVDIRTNTFPDFTYAAENAVDGVVFVKVLKVDRSRPISIFEHLFGYNEQNSRGRESMSSGSGVIISPNGYIVTNNHVVANATDIEITLTNNKSYRAKLVGADPATDIALLEIEGENLPYLKFANSDSLRLGEWVLAIGSPYNLRSTVTAGIVSAKGRSLPDMSGRFKIESFIQTDAAVNPGNSGGALVNKNGEVVGINTAIASQTGAFSGYSFAVPTSIVKKVVADIKEFGAVQRAVLGISMLELTDKLADFAGVKKDYRGAFIADIDPNGSAYVAGLRENDVIISINGVTVKNPSEVQERINAFRPNDNVGVSIIRKGSLMEFLVKL